jgi:hypothetical protein
MPRYWPCSDHGIWLSVRRVVWRLCRRSCTDRLPVRQLIGGTAARKRHGRNPPRPVIPEQHLAVGGTRRRRGVGGDPGPRSAVCSAGPCYPASSPRHRLERGPEPITDDRRDRGPAGRPGSCGSIGSLLCRWSRYRDQRHPWAGSSDSVRETSSVSSGGPRPAAGPPPFPGRRRSCGPVPLPSGVRRGVSAWSTRSAADTERGASPWPPA